VTATTTDTTTLPAGATPDVPPWAGTAYADCLAILPHARDREIAAQVLDQMTGEATGLAAAALEADDYDQHLAWTETAGYLNLLACAMRGFTPEYPDPEANRGWARERWMDLAAANGPAEFTVLFTDLHLTLLQATDPDDCDGGDLAHPDAVARLADAATALGQAPWQPLATVRQALPGRAGHAA
jgi:hypothetical protein